MHTATLAQHYDTQLLKFVENRTTFKSICVKIPIKAVALASIQALASKQASKQSIGCVWNDMDQGGRDTGPGYGSIFTHHSEPLHLSKLKLLKQSPLFNNCSICLAMIKSVKTISKYKVEHIQRCLPHYRDYSLMEATRENTC